MNGIMNKRDPVIPLPPPKKKGELAFSLFVWRSSLVFNEILLNSFKTIQKQKAFIPVDVKNLFLPAMSHDIPALAAEWPVGEGDRKKAE